MIIWFVASACVFAAGPANVAEANAGADVRIVVDTSETPDLAEWGKKAGDTARLWRPKIAELLKSDGEKPYDTVTIVFKNKPSGIAAASGSTITITADWVRKHPD